MRCGSGLIERHSTIPVPYMSSYLCSITLVLFSLVTNLLANDSPSPDPKLTPGDPVAGATIEQLQEAAYSKHHRRVLEALRRAVFAE